MTVATALRLPLRPAAERCSKVRLGLGTGRLNRPHRHAVLGAPLQAERIGMTPFGIASLLVGVIVPSMSAAPVICKMALLVGQMMLRHFN